MTPIHLESTPPGAPQPKTNSFAIASLVLGILALLSCVVGVLLGILFAIPGLICGIMGIKQIKNSGGADNGHKLAVNGTVLNSIALILLLALALIVIPNFIKARESSARSSCPANLKTIDAVKATWALENKKTQPDTPTDAELFGDDKYLREKPTCPKGGVYTINPVGSKPACTIPGHTF